MNWTEPKPPTKGESYYDHTTCETPLGKFIIEWKSWKESPDYGVMLENEYIGTGYDLQEAKDLAKEYIYIKFREISAFINFGEKE